MLRVEITGAAKLKAALAKMQDTLDEQLEVALREAAVLVRDEARALCPVDTGSLRKSIRLHTYERTANVHQIGVTAAGYVTNPRTGQRVNYAAYVEYGTRWTRARPFLRPALRNQAGNVRRLLAEAMRRAKGEALR